LVIPLSVSYSLLGDDFAGANDVHDDADGRPAPDGAGGERGGATDDDATATAADEAEERDAFFIGLGDAVIPTVMIASAATFSPATALSVPLIGLNLPALLAMVGTLAGLLVLLNWVMKGRAHAGLPLLNGGAIGGYLIGSVVAGVPLIEALGIAAAF
jgi:presenilin-like A22 family membrane protease